MTWQKSSYSADPDNNCLELAGAAPAVLYVRESDDPGAVISPSARALGALLEVTKSGALARLVR